jgi:glucokinase
VLGVDIGGSRVKAVVLDGGRILARHEEPRNRPITEVLSRIVESTENEHHITALGVGIAGLVDHRAGRFVWGPHLPDQDIDVSGHLDSLIESHVVENDANCAAFAEWATGPAAGHRVALTVSVGTGIGAGLIVDGAVWRGSGFAGEVGHMRVTDADLECPCGRSGCWETVVSGRQLGMEAARLGLQPTAEALVMAARNGSRSASDSLRQAGNWLGVGIISLILVLDPGVVVVAGGVSAAGDPILDAARERIASELPGATHRPTVEVAQASHGRWAAAVGAAHLAARGRVSERFEET